MGIAHHALEKPECGAEVLGFLEGESWWAMPTLQESDDFAFPLARFDLSSTSDEASVNALVGSTTDNRRYIHPERGEFCSPGGVGTHPHEHPDRPHSHPEMRNPLVSGFNFSTTLIRGA